MALDTFVGAFSTGTASGDLDITTVGFQPKCVIFWWCGRTGAVDAVGEGGTGSGTIAYRGFGWAIGTTPSTHQRCKGSSSLDGAAAADLGSCSANAVIATVSSAGAFDGKATLTSFLSNGFRLNISDAFPVSLRVGFLAIGGTDLTDMAIHDFVDPTVDTQVVDYVISPSFQPTMLLFMGSQTTVANDTAAQLDSGISFGWAKGTAAADQVVWSSNSDDGSGTMDCDGYCKSGECLAMILLAGGNTAARATLSAINSDGFELTWTEAAATAQRYSALALKGPQFAVGSFSTSTTINTDITESGFGFQPKAAMFISRWDVENTAGTAQASDRLSIGAFDGAGNEHAQAWIDRNGTLTADLGTAVEHDEVYATISGVGAPSLDALVGLQSIDADGFTLNQDDADPAASFVGWWAIGAAAAGGTQFTQSVAGTLTTAGALSKQARTSKAGTLTSAGALLRQVATAKAGTLTSSGALLRQVRRTLVGTLTSAGALAAVRLVFKALDGTLSSAGALVREVRRALAGTLSSAGALQRSTSRSLAGTLSSSGALLAVRTVLVAVAGTLSTAGALVRQPRTSLAGTLPSSGALTRRPARALAGTLASSGALATAKVVLKALAGTLSSSGTLTRQARHLLAGTLSSSGTLTKRTNRSLAGTLATAGALAAGRIFARVFAGTLTAAGTLTRRTEKQLAGVLATSGTLQRQARRALGAVLGFVGALVRSLIPQATLNPAASPGYAYTAALEAQHYRSTPDPATMTTMLEAVLDVEV